MKKRIRYIFTGYVQGVGFRFRAYHAANLMNITGWVRNEYDGSVTIEAQGEKHDIDAMLQLIKKGRYIGIDNIESQELPVDSDENSFSIRD